VQCEGEHNVSHKHQTENKRRKGVELSRIETNDTFNIKRSKMDEKLNESGIYINLIVNNRSSHASILNWVTFSVSM